MKIIVNNLAVKYEDSGGGPVMLLLHGWMTSLRTFDALVPILSGQFRMVRLDFPGFGGSETPKEAWGIGEYARFTFDFCKKLDIRPEIIVGHSFGGRVMLKGMPDGLLAPKKVVFIASAGLATRTSKAALFLIAAKIGKLCLFFLPAGIRERIRRRLYGMAGSTDYLDVSSPVLRETFLRSIKEDLTDSAKQVQAPALLICGRKDVVTPLSDGKRLAELISGSRLEVIEGAAHFVHEERPREVADLIKKFIYQ